MSFAARAARLAMVASVFAASSLFVSGTTGSQAVFAANGESAQSASTASAQTTQRSRLSQRQRIVNIAESYVGHAQYRFGAEGTHYMDCSGLVWRVYKQAGLEAKIGGVRRGARGYYHWFKNRGLASRTNPQLGDLVIWHKGKHIGVYVGNGYAVSALNEKMDVRKHRVNWLSGFTAYLHVQLGDKGATSTSSAVTSVKADVNGLRVRDGAGTEFDKVATVDKGTVMKVIDWKRDTDDKKWFEVKLANGKIGWVASWLVTAVD